MQEACVAGSCVLILYEYLTRQGLDPVQVLGEPLDESAQAVPMLRWQAMLKRVDELEQKPALALRIAQGISARHFGAVGYAALACQNLVQALQRLERFHALVCDANRATVRGDDHGVSVEWGGDRGGLGALADEMAVASVVQLGRDLLGRDDPVQSVSLVNPGPADVAPYEAFFGGPVTFGAKATRLVLPLAYAVLPLRKADPALLVWMDHQAEQLLDQVASVPVLLGAWRRTLVPLIREGRMTLDALAHAHHMSARSFQRRLTEQGMSFRSLLDQTRQHLAEGYLREARLDLGEISQLLGYSEQSAFTRAFRHWTGMAPTQWRKQHA